MGCVHFTNISHCTAAEKSRCSRRAFWHAPTARGDTWATCAVWWVILIAVLAALDVVASACAGVVLAVNAAVRHIRLRWQRGAVSLFKMARSDVPFVPTRQTTLSTARTRSSLPTGRFRSGLSRRCSCTSGTRGGCPQRFSLSQRSGETSSLSGQSRVS